LVTKTWRSDWLQGCVFTGRSMHRGRHHLSSDGWNYFTRLPTSRTVRVELPFGAPIRRRRPVTPIPPGARPVQCSNFKPMFSSSFSPSSSVTSGHENWKKKRKEKPIVDRTYSFHGPGANGRSFTDPVHLSLAPFLACKNRSWIWREARRPGLPQVGRPSLLALVCVLRNRALSFGKEPDFRNPDLHTPLFFQYEKSFNFCVSKLHNCCARALSLSRHS
jgi:hypothetical protein